MAPSPGEVRIEVPATTDHVALCRIAAAGMVGGLDPDVDQIEDLRIAVDELVTLLVESAQDAGDQRVRIELRCEGPVLHVIGSIDSTTAELALDELTERILDSTADGYEVRAGGFTLHKRVGRA